MLTWEAAGHYRQRFRPGSRSLGLQAVVLVAGPLLSSLPSLGLNPGQARGGADQDLGCFFSAQWLVKRYHCS